MHVIAMVVRNVGPPPPRPTFISSCSIPMKRWQGVVVSLPCPPSPLPTFPCGLLFQLSPAVGTVAGTAVGTVAGTAVGTVPGTAVGTVPGQLWK